MKILQINKFFYLKGGAEKYFFDLSELLEKKGHHVLVFSTKHPKNYKWPNQEDFVSYLDYSKKEGALKDLKKIFRIFSNREAKKKLAKLIEKEKPDIAHLHNIFHHLSSSIVSVLKKANIPIVLTLHDYKLFCPNYKFYSQNKVCYDCIKKKNFKSCVAKKCVKNSRLKSYICALEAKWHKYLKLTDMIDAFIAPSQFIRNKAIEAGIAKEKVFYLPNFIETPKNIIEQNSAQPAKNNRYILFFGRISEEKGVDVLIKAFCRIAKKYPDWKLKIAGSGPKIKNLKELALLEKKQIIFLGRQKKDKMQDLIADAYLTVMPSLWPENFPYSILESFMRQKPVIASNIGGLPELIENQITGLLAKPHNANDLAKKIEWAIEHPKKIRQIGKTGQLKIIVLCNPEKHYRELINIYEKIKNK